MGETKYYVCLIFGWAITIIAFVIIEKAELERLKSLEAKEAREPRFNFCEVVK